LNCEIKLGQAAKNDCFSRPTCIAVQIQEDPRQRAEAPFISLGYKPQEAAKGDLHTMDSAIVKGIIKAALKREC